MSKPSKKPIAAKKLLESRKCILNARCFYDALIAAGAMELVEYTSSTGSGEIKKFERISNTYLHFGLNVPNPFHHCKTEPRFYEDAFADAYRLACKAIAAQAATLK